MLNRYIQTQKKLLGLIIVGSVFSLLAAGYQTFEYIITGNCGCSADDNPIFQTYSVIMGIPVSFLGVVGVIITLGFALIFIIPDNRKPFDFLRINKLPDQTFILWYVFQIVSVLFIFNLMYIAYILAKTFCDLCAISQGVAIINWFILTILLVKSKEERYRFIDSQ